jgi:hypothetical protein
MREKKNSIPVAQTTPDIFVVAALLVPPSDIRRLQCVSTVVVLALVFLPLTSSRCRRTEGTGGKNVPVENPAFAGALSVNELMILHLHAKPQAPITSFS